MINLGIIGYTPGNGHPYSYSSIFNSYKKDLMKNSPYPGIAEYLSKYNSSNDLINYAKISHIWTQDIKRSKKIALATNISNIVDHYEEMVGIIDGLIIARDDYESHLELAKPFINAGTPIFIDKPLAIRKKTASEILNHQKYDGQIFSSSGLAYDPRVIEAKKNLNKIGKIKFLQGTAPGKWENYAIHLIDCFLSILGEEFIFKKFNTTKNNNVVCLNGILNNNAIIEMKCMGGLASPLRITIVGTNGFYDIDFSDPYCAFKNILDIFASNIKNKKIIRSKKEIIHSIGFIELGFD